MDDIILDVRDVSKIYMQGKIPVTALHDVTLSVEKGEFVAIMGPSGSGKSTLMGIVGCLEKPTAGKVIIDGIEVTSVSDRQLPRIRREKIGFVFQHYNLLTSLTALGNVELAMRFSHVSRRERLERAETLLKKLGLGERLNHKPTELSGGEQQRVSIARAMANWPAIILADEPTGEVDSKTRDAIVETFKLLKSRGQTIIVVTHDPDVAKHCDRVLRIVDGTIVNSD
jgi:putative ABC transport system ATP-binding protein